MVDASETGGPADRAVVDGALGEPSGAAARALAWRGAAHPDVWPRGWSPHGDGDAIAVDGVSDMDPILFA